MNHFKSLTMWLDAPLSNNHYTNRLPTINAYVWLSCSAFVIILFTDFPCSTSFVLVISDLLRFLLCFLCSGSALAYLSVVPSVPTFLHNISEFTACVAPSFLWHRQLSPRRLSFLCISFFRYFRISYTSSSDFSLCVLSISRMFFVVVVHL